jgi:hypothetical protein
MSASAPDRKRGASVSLGCQLIRNSVATRLPGPDLMRLIETAKQRSSPDAQGKRGKRAHHTH